MLALTTLLSHWQRSPGQLFALVLGLALATGLWSGVQAINEEARQSYARAAATLGAGSHDRLVMSDGSPVPLASYAALRRAGWLVSPVIEGQVSIGGDSWRVIGVEPLTAPYGLLPSEAAETLAQPQTFLSGRGVGFVADPSQIVSDTGDLPDLVASDRVMPGTILTDIRVAARLLDIRDPSYLILWPDQPLILPDGAAYSSLTRQSPRGGEDLSRLTDSFHLNLTAFGFLSFAVGLFIVHATVGLAFEQRRPVFRTLRALGVPLPHLAGALLVEITVLAILSGVMGILLGYALAAALLPNVAGTLRSLYGAEITGTLAFRPIWAGVGLGLAIIGAWASAAQSLWKLIRMPLLAPAQPRAWAMASDRLRRVQVWAALILFAASALLAVVDGGLVSGFLCLGALLVGAALLLPALLSAGLSVCAARLRTPMAEWVIADARQQLPGLSLALMALLLALAANIGVSTMVGSFRSTFLGWLNQRLVAELYITAADNAQAEQIRDFLAPRVEATLPIAYTDARINGVPGQVYGVLDHSTYRDNWPLLETIPDVWTQLAAGDVALINEQLSRREGLELGDIVALSGDLRVPVGAIYSDYGNPNVQAIIGLTLLDSHFPDVARHRIAVRVAPDRRAEIIDVLDQTFDLPSGAVVDQETVKQASIRVFEQTFRVTAALNVMTLAVAAFALWASLLTLSQMRLPQVAPIWALGIQRARLARMEVIKALVLVALTWLVALPVGLILAWVLLAIVNVEAFGWRLPMQVFPVEWLRLLGLAMLSSTLAAAYPARVLLRIPPAQLLKVFSNER